jgi:hypothetical protein
MICRPPLPDGYWLFILACDVIGVLIGLALGWWMTRK